MSTPGPPLLRDDLVERAARRFRVLGDPVRLRLLNAMRVRGELSVQALMDETDQRQANVSKHLGILARDGLVQRRREGTSVYYSLSDPSLPGVCLLVAKEVEAIG
ncbi:MAG: metalloregulator ArsR/SmtB family transcription factor [Bacteroidota bacterium]